MGVVRHRDRLLILIEDGQLPPVCHDCLRLRRYRWDCSATSAKVDRQQQVWCRDTTALAVLVVQGVAEEREAIAGAGAEASSRW